MSRLLSRRKMMIGVGGAVAVAPLAMVSSAAADSTGPLVVLTTPVRLYDSRTDAVPLGGAKLSSGNSVIVTAAGFGASGFLVAAYINVTVTQTEGSGFLRVNGSDLSGERPVPNTSNVNWFANNQTVANLALTTVGGENGIEVFCGGGGRTHVVVDIMGYIPFVA
jgi:hypothetical protein